MPANAMYQVPASVRNALSGPEPMMGMDPNVNRLALLPRYSKADGLVAPQWVYDMARAVEAPGNALMGRTSAEDAQNFALNFGMGGLGTSAMMRNPAPGPGRTVAATVYHGSPYKFDRFDSSKIGTGEGAQAFGHGIYLAESPNVAREYMPRARYDVNANGEPVYFYNGQAYHPSQDARDLIDATITKREALDRADPRFGEKWTALTKELDSAEKAYDESRKAGYGGLYTVDLPDEHIANMLDWDKPLSQQPGATKAALNRLFTERPDIAEYLGVQQYDLRAGPDLYKPLGGLLGDAEASALLNKYGIPGIRYLDGGSRGAAGNGRWLIKYGDGTSKVMDFRPNDSVLQSMGATAEPQGTSNFVVFDPANTTKILKRE